MVLLNILHTVQFYEPSVGGMQEVVKQLSERLAQLGHHVTVATSRERRRKKLIINGVTVREFNVSGNQVVGFRGEKKNYVDFILNSEFDVVTNFAAQQWATDLILPHLEEIRGKKVFVPTGFSALYLPQYRHYFQNMKRWMNQYDMNVFLSYKYRDIEFAKKNQIEKRMVIPNGADEREFTPKSSYSIRKKLHIPKADTLILHVGSHTGSKGHKEAIDIFSKAEIVNCTFLIAANTVGNGCGNQCKIREFISSVSPDMKKRNKRLIIKSLPRKDVIQAYKDADMFLFPSNIECSPLVLFECMASKTPFLATDVGNSKEIISWSKSGVLLPTIKKPDGYCTADVDKSALLLEKMYHSQNRRIKMAENGYKAWKRSFTWEKINQQYEKLYYHLVNK